MKKAESSDTIATKKEIYRRAGLKDVDDIYRIASKTQLVNKPVLMSNRGFLLDHYTPNPHKKEEFADSIFNSIFLVCENRKGILGFLQGHESEQWLKQRPNMCGVNECKIHWDEETLLKLGISNIENFYQFGVIDKVAVDKTLGKKRVAYNLIKLFAKLLLEKGKKYVLSEIVTRVYCGDKPLNIKNKASIRFHRKLGFKKVGESEKYSYEDTFLKDKGFFKDEIYMAKINDLPYQYKRIFQVIK
ncbi:MAG TPA: GNAT family N-acetyltransferase [Firmicutes bacterium]|nr:GNAT family N-acetyltransferase [Bacillota bacterium]